MSESFRSVWIFAEASYKIFDYAKKRVYRLVRSDGVQLNGPSKNVKNKKRKLKEDDKYSEEGKGLLLCPSACSGLYLDLVMWLMQSRT